MKNANIHTLLKHRILTANHVISITFFSRFRDEVRTNNHPQFGHCQHGACQEEEILQGQEGAYVQQCQPQLPRVQGAGGGN